MKHIWYIDDNNFILNEGYVMDDYKKYDYNYVWEYCDNEIYVHNLGIFETENIFENKETAVNMFNGMVLIQIKKLENYINDCKNKIDILTDKLLMDNIVVK